MAKISRNKLRLHRKRRVRAKIKGVLKRPRLSVFKSLKDLSVQLVDDVSGKTLVSGNLKKVKAKNDMEGAKKLGQVIAKKCLEQKIIGVVFDRGGYKYHGKIKALAEGARAGGLKF